MIPHITTFNFPVPRKKPQICVFCRKSIKEHKKIERGDFPFKITICPNFPKNFGALIGTKETIFFRMGD